MTRPAPDADLSAWRAAGIGTVVSLLEPDEAARLGIGNEKVMCRTAGLDYVNFPIPDMQLPDRAAFTTFASTLASRIRAGDHLAVHCRASIGRTGMLTCAVLGQFAYDASAALAHVSAARGVAVPDTPAQRAFIHDLLNPTT